MDPIQKIDHFERAASDALLSAFHAGGREQDWRAAEYRLRALESGAEREGLESTGRLLIRALEQVATCIRQPEIEMARLRANGFATARAAGMDA